MTTSPQLLAKIAIWRQKAADKTLSEEDMLEAVMQVREGRVSASVASASSKAKVVRKIAKASIDAEDLLADMDGEL